MLLPQWMPAAETCAACVTCTQDPIMARGAGWGHGGLARSATSTPAPPIIFYSGGGGARGGGPIFRGTRAPATRRPHQARRALPFNSHHIYGILGACYTCCPSFSRGHPLWQQHWSSLQLTRQEKQPRGSGEGGVGHKQALFPSPGRGPFSRHKASPPTPFSLVGRSGSVSGWGCSFGQKCGHDHGGATIPERGPEEAAKVGHTPGCFPTRGRQHWEDVGLGPQTSPSPSPSPCSSL